VEDAEEQVGGVDLGAAVPLCRLPRDAEDLLRRRGNLQPHAQVLPGDVQVLGEGKEDGLDVQPDRRHQILEHRLLLVGEGDEQVLEAKIVVMPALRLLDRGVEHPVPGLGELFR